MNTEVEKSQTETLPVSCCLSIPPVFPWFFILLQSFLFIYWAKWEFHMHVQLLLSELGLVLPHGAASLSQVDLQLLLAATGSCVNFSWNSGSFPGCLIFRGAAGNCVGSPSCLVFSTKCE